MTQAGGGSSNKKIIATPPQGHVRFSTPFAACNFVVNWDGQDVRELLEAILCARRMGDRFIQDKLIEYILAIPLRHPRPEDVPPYAGAPVWAVDRSGKALIGMPGRETIVEASALRRGSLSETETHSSFSSNSSSAVTNSSSTSMMRNGTDGYPS
jgi:hypothetical protein